jgi:hypothetical protein
LPEQLPNAIDKVRADRPGSSITFDSDDDAVAVVEGVSTLPTAIADVVEQIIRNNDEVNINITVRSDPVESDPEEGMTWVTIRDDGDGLPEQDVQAVGEGKETPLGHAEGLALWCLEWTVNKADGELVVDCGEVTAEVGLDQSDNAESIRRERPIK